LQWQLDTSQSAKGSLGVVLSTSRKRLLPSDFTAQQALTPGATEVDRYGLLAESLVFFGRLITPAFRVNTINRNTAKRMNFIVEPLHNKFLITLFV
jgi:hypothetical protein